jgi:hypothetical protein
VICSNPGWLAGRPSNRPSPAGAHCPGAGGLGLAECQRHPASHPGDPSRLSPRHPIAGRHCPRPAAHRMGLGWLDPARPADGHGRVPGQRQILCRHRPGLADYRQSRLPGWRAHQKPGGNVIYVDGEMVPQILNRAGRVVRAGQAQTVHAAGRPRRNARPGQSALPGPPVRDDRDSQAGVDCDRLALVPSIRNGQNGVEDVRALIGYLTRLAGWANCALVLIHHIRKTNNGGSA